METENKPAETKEDTLTPEEKRRIVVDNMGDALSHGVRIVRDPELY
jgi:hypothetical protein